MQVLHEVAPLPVMTAVDRTLDEAEDADRRVVAWARGKDIVGMLRTFGAIYQGADPLPDNLVYPDIQNSSDVRKTYL